MSLANVGLVSGLDQGTATTKKKQEIVLIKIIDFSTNTE
jgi:hypothetical protein